jgi:lipid-binding SYLF domain-containing protein
MVVESPMIPEITCRCRLIARYCFTDNTVADNQGYANGLRLAIIHVPIEFKKCSSIEQTIEIHKGNTMRNILLACVGMSILGWTGGVWAWDPDEVEELEPKVAEAVATLKEKDPGVQSFFDKAAGYAVFPTVGKAGFGIGGARGKGLLYKGGAVVAVTTLSQLSIGFQWGGQAYSEYIFFEDDVALTDFMRGNYELGAQASAVAVTAGASADANYSSGVAIFTVAKGGLMYEASVGGQKFKVEEK